MSIDHNPVDGFHHADVQMFSVISSNRVQLRTHNYELARAHAHKLHKLGYHVCVEDDDFALHLELSH